MAVPSITQQQLVELVSTQWNKFSEEATKELHEVESIRPTLYSDMSIDTAYWNYYHIGGLPDFPKFNGTFQYLDVAPGFGIRLEPAEFGAALEVEYKFDQNNISPLLKNRAEMLSRSLHLKKEKIAVQGYANLTSNAFDFTPWNEEGVPIASTMHKTKSPWVNTSVGGFSNLGTSVFNPTSLEATRILMRGFRGLNGELLSTVPNGFIGGTTMDRAFEEVTATPLGLYTADHTVNVQNKRNWEYKTSQYFNDFFSDSRNWIMVDWKMLKQLAVWQTRISDESAATIDFETKRIKTSLYSYFGCGFLGWQFCYFNQVG